MDAAFDGSKGNWLTKAGWLGFELVDAWEGSVQEFAHMGKTSVERVEAQKPEAVVEIPGGPRCLRGGLT
jgi:hypothetical protein